MDDNTIATLRGIFDDVGRDLREYSERLYSALVFTEIQKRYRGAVATPPELKQKMLDLIPDEVWARDTLRVLEPCCGMNGFLLDIVHRVVRATRERFDTDEECYRNAVENHLFFGDIEPMNVAIAEAVLDPLQRGYQLNSYTGDALKKDWGIQFDVVIGNPPYQAPAISQNASHCIWPKFVKKALDEWVAPGGFLVFVHPSGWRKPPLKRSPYWGLLQKMTRDYWMRFLSIHSTRDGMKMFKCGTRYDWYMIETIPPEDRPTFVVDERGEEHYLRLHQWPFVPNHSFNQVLSLIGEDIDSARVIFDRSKYSSEREWVNMGGKLVYDNTADTRREWIIRGESDDAFKYPLIHSTPKSGVRVCWSSRDRGYFGVPKVIFGICGITHNIVVDYEGLYGITHCAMGIPIESEEDGEQLKSVLLSPAFKNILSACSWSNFRIDWKLFLYLKKRWWVGMIP